MSRPLLTLLLAPVVLAGCRSDTANPADAAPPGGGETIAPAVMDEVLANMDAKADPCQDFYRYACGGWMDSTPLPPDEPRYGRFNALRERNKEALRDILASTSDPKLKGFYGACMDEAAVEQRGLTSVQPLLDDVKAVKDRTSLMRTVADLHRHRVQVFFDLEVGPDYANPELNIAHVGQGGLGLPDREYYLAKDPRGDALRAGYRDHVRKNLELVGVPAAEAAKQAEKILAFETKLAEVQKPRDELRDPEKHYNRVDRAGLMALTPSLPWAAFFEGTGHPEVNDLNVAPKEYFIGLEKILAATDMATLQAYLRWHVIKTAAEHLPKRFVDEHFAFYLKTLRGQQELAPRWKRCVDTTDRALGELLGQSYVESHFAGQSRKIALDMIKGIEEAFAAGLPKLPWMDETTRTRALEKMKAVVNKIGHPDAWRDYAALQVGEDHLANVWAASAFEFERRADDVGEPVDRAEWHMSPPTVNAYYNPSMNEMVFPAGILQPPFFSPDYPMAMNFGGIGMVMGHELTHGFDDQGRKFDGTGRLRTWWEAQVSERFDEEAQCVSDLYSSYEVQPGLHLNGKLTLGENIADLGGIKEAYRAYRGWAAANNVDPKAAAAEGLTQEQLFFVSFGQIWCSKSTEEVERVLALTDPHSHPRFRVNGPLSQLPEFWETFSCESGEPMHPQNVCEVW